MAVRIPGVPLSDASIDTDRGGMPRPRADLSLAHALSGFGGAVADAAVGFQELQSKRDAFDDESKFLLHREKAESALDQAKRQMPAEATGFKDMFAATRAKEDEAFLNGLTPASRQKIAPRLDAFRERLSNHAADAEFQARSKVELDAVGAGIDAETRKVMVDPSYRDMAIANIGAQLGTLDALPPAKRAELKRLAAVSIEAAQASGEYRGRSRELAAALGVPHPAASNDLPATASPGARMKAEDVRGIFLAEVKRQGLVGTVPKDGAKYGIKTGSAEEWANLFTGLSYHESGHDNRTVGDVGQFDGGSRGLLQLSYQDAPSHGMNNGKPFTKEQLADPNFNAAVGVAIAKKLMDGAGSIRGGMGKYWGPISKEGWVPGQGRDRGLPWAAWGGGAAGPTVANAASQPGGPAPDTRFASLPLAERMRLVDEAYKREKQAETQTRADFKAFQMQNKEVLRLGIANDDPTVTITSINEKAKSGDLDIGDAAALIETLKTQEGKNAGVSEFLARMAKGELVAAPFDTEGNKFADGAYEKLKKAAPTEAHQPIAEEIAKAHGSAPKDYVQAIMGDLASIDQPEKVLAGLQRAQRLQGASKTALGRGEYQRVEAAAVMFRHFVEDLGMTPDEAARKYMAVTDPAKRKSVDEPTAEKEAKRLTVGDVTNAFDGILMWEPSAGNTHAQSAAMLGDYRELFKMEYMQTGDADAAKAKALDHFKKSYGVTRLGGSNVLMKHPPENYYPPIDDSHDWMQKQVVEAVKQATGKDYDPAKVFVVTTTATDADVRAKRAPSYEVWVEDKDANGYADFKPITGRGRFVFDPMAALNKPEAMAKRQAEMVRREKAKQDLDNAGWWWEFATRALAP